MRRTRKNEAGFTLMELMIVMMIIGVLTTLAIPSFVGAIAMRGKPSSRKTCA